VYCIITVADGSVRVGVTRQGVYGDVTVRWTSSHQVGTDVTAGVTAAAASDDDDVSLGIVQPASGSVTLSNGQPTAIFSVKVICLFLSRL